MRREKLQIHVLDLREEKEHFHQDIELLYVLDGELDVFMGELTTHMKAEDILVINADKKHRLLASGDILYAKLMIEYQLVSDVFQSNEIIFWCDSTKGESERFVELRSAIKLLLQHYLSTRGGTANFGHIALCYRVMEILSVNFLVQTADKERLSDEDRFEQRIFQINTYIRLNYNRQISLTELADKLYLSTGYLSRFFKKNYGMNLTDYLNEVRLYHAVDELLHSNTPITRIAYDNGFASVAIFNKSFKKAYGETPSAMRKRAVEQKEEKAEEEGISYAEERLDQLLHSEGTEKVPNTVTDVIEAVHSAKDAQSICPVWRKMINGGSAEDLLRSEVREHIILLREALKFEYIRFWNIFSKEMLIDIGISDGTYNFSRLDSILDFLLSSGLKPWIELGQKPRRILKNVQEQLVFEESFRPLDSPEQWDEFLMALMYHLEQRYGREEIDTWVMELWFDERYRQGNDAVERYFRLFNRTRSIVRKYSSGLQVGGCGIRFDDELGAQFLIEWKKQEHQPDFISVLYFAYERGEIRQDIYSKRNTDNEYLLHSVGKIRASMEKAGLEDKPLCFTEWNLTISDRNFINDTCFKGAYVVKNVLDVCEKVDVLAYFLGSDRVSEYFDTHGLLFGGSGLLSKDSILKPAGFAIEFLNRLYEFRIAKGKNYLITTNRHNSYKIICHNQKRLNYNYYFTKENEIKKEQIRKYFEDRESLELMLRLTDVENGDYQVKIYRINENSGSVLKMWKDMEFERELSREDISYLRRVCEPRLIMHKANVQDGVFSLLIGLLPNEIAYIHIRKR